MDLKNRQIFYNAQLLLNKNKNKIEAKYANIGDIFIEKKNLINKNILEENGYLIINPNSNIIMHYKSSSNLKNIISDIKRLLKYARF